MAPPLRLFFPFLSITTASRACPNLKSSAAEVPLRPPGWVFGVVWPILYVTTGLAWQRSRLDSMFVSLLVLLCAWLVVYSCRGKKSKARYVLAVATLLSWRITSKLRASGGGYLMTLPLSVWLAFATYLNYAEVAARDSETLNTLKTPKNLSPKCESCRWCR